MPVTNLSLTDYLAARADDDVLLVTASEQLTGQMCRARAGALAAELVTAGVTAGDRVATLQPLSAEALLLWWALDRLGAVYLPLNPTWTPRLAGRVVADRRPTLLIADPSLRELAEAAAGDVAVLDPPTGHARGDVPAIPRDPRADCAVVHNSGLPGIHHGLRVTSRMLSVMGSAMSAAHPRDRVLVAAPTCFMGTLVTVHGALASGGSVAVLPGLTANTFWPAVRAAGVTFAALMNPTLADLMARPATELDHDHPLRLVTAPAGQAELNAAGVERFGFHWLTGLAKTEVCGAVSAGPDPSPADGVGRVQPPFTGRVVDPDGNPVGVDEAGELVLRCDIEGGLPDGYADDPAAGAHLWRGGWLHTGWHLRQDAAGSLHPVGTMSVHPIVVKRAGYLFASDLEAEIAAVGAGVIAARVDSRPGPDPLDDPVVIAWVTGDVGPESLRCSLRAGLPAHLVPDVVVPVAELPVQPETVDVPADAWRL